MKATLLVLAAGIGSRYGGLKQIDPVGPSGEIIIDYSIFDAIRAGFDKVVFVIRRDIEDSFKESIGSRYEGKIEIDYAFQELDAVPDSFEVPAERKKPWGTGHAILVAEDKISTPFAVINADDFYGRNGFQLLSGFLNQADDSAKPAEYCMAGFVLRNTLSEFGTVSRGVCQRDSNGMLEEVVERTKIEKVGAGARYFDENGAGVDLTGDEIASMNMWGFTPSVFSHLREKFVGFLNEQGGELKSEFFIPTVVAELLESSQATVKVLETSDSWFGITYKEDKAAVVAKVKALVSQGDYPEKLF